MGMFVHILSSSLRFYMAINKEDNNETKICLCCTKEKKYTTNNFYQNVNPYINDSFRFCKKCTKKVVDYNNMESILFLLHILDKPFIQDKWEECLKSKKDTWGEYIRQISSLPQYKDLIWKDGDITKRSEEHTSELQSRQYLVCRLLLEKKKTHKQEIHNV